MTLAPLTLRGHNPDVLTCIANLSNDEVFTPPEMANAMLDLVADAWADTNDGANIWADEKVTFLDPFVKSGVFLREIVRRLTDGLATKFPDLEERVNYILTKQVFGIGITELTALLARRSVYCSKFANGLHSIAKSFGTEDGNIWFERTEHSWVGGTPEIRYDPVTSYESSVYVNRRCSFCGANERDYRRDGDLETHAYALIHAEEPQALIHKLFGAHMQFDVIIGNPPYQLGDGGGGGGASATPIYNLFAEKALALNPRFAVMITPSRWFSGGKGLDSFRDHMLTSDQLIEVVDYPQLYDVFPGVKIRGGVSYWLWGRDHLGDCRVTTKVGSEQLGESVTRSLSSYDVLIRRNEAVEILAQIQSFHSHGQQEVSLAERVSARKPFGLTGKVGHVSRQGINDPVLIFGNQTTSFLPRSSVCTNAALIDRWKVLVVKAHGTSGREDRTILGKPIVAGPGSACTETYLVIDSFDDIESAEYLAAYLRTRFARFLVSLRKITQNITRDTYRFVPLVPLTHAWTDDELYVRYGLTGEQVAFVESMIAPPSEESSGSVEAVSDDDE